MSSLDPKAARYADSILSAGGALMSLIDDLLDLGDPDNPDLPQVRNPVALQATMSDLCEWWRREADKKGVDVRLKLAPDVPEVVAIDQPRIRRVLSNLMGNAVRYANAGHVELEVARAPDGNRLIFAVRDTGPGMSTDTLAEFEQDFATADADHTNESGGFRLGLLVSRKIAAEMGARLELENAQSGGCLARLSVPFQTVSEHQPTAKPTEPASSESASRRILVAEDNELSRSLMRELLEQMGYNVTLANDGAEAVEQARQGGFDVILMDITMPQLDGMTATRMIQTLPPPESEVPILACTAQTDRESQDRYRAAGMAGFLQKPVRANDMARLLNAVVDRDNRPTWAN